MPVVLNAPLMRIPLSAGTEQMEKEMPARRTCQPEGHVSLSAAKDLRRWRTNRPATEILSAAKDDIVNVARSIWPLTGAINLAPTSNLA